MANFGEGQDGKMARWLIVLCPLAVLPFNRFAVLPPCLLAIPIDNFGSIYQSQNK